MWCGREHEIKHFFLIKCPEMLRFQYNMGTHIMGAFMFQSFSYSCYHGNHEQLKFVCCMSQNIIFCEICLFNFIVLKCIGIQILSLQTCIRHLEQLTVMLISMRSKTLSAIFLSTQHFQDWINVFETVVSSR